MYALLLASQVFVFYFYRYYIIRRLVSRWGNLSAARRHILPVSVLSDCRLPHSMGITEGRVACSNHTVSLMKHDAVDLTWCFLMESVCSQYVQCSPWFLVLLNVRQSLPTLSLIRNTSRCILHGGCSKPELTSATNSIMPHSLNDGTQTSRFTTQDVKGDLEISS